MRGWNSQQAARAGAGYMTPPQETLPLLSLHDSSPEDSHLQSWVIPPPASSPGDLHPAEPTFIVDAAIGVFLTSHQFLHFILSQPLTWQGREAESHHPEM